MITENELANMSLKIERLEIENEELEEENTELKKQIEKGVVIAEGEINDIKWESPYNKLVFYFKGLPKMIGIKTIKNKKVKIILKEVKWWK